jgi:hypothetical protein
MTDKPKVRGGIVGSGFAVNLHFVAQVIHTIAWMRLAETST